MAARYRYADFGDFIEAFKWVMGYLRSPEHYALATRRLLEELARENVRYAEITLSAGVVLWRKQDFAAVYDAVTREAARRPVNAYWVLDAVRQFGVEPAMEVARLAAERAGRSRGGVRIGRRRGARDRPSVRRGAVVRATARARIGSACGRDDDSGVGVGRAYGTARERIGHGIRASDDPALLRELRGRDIPLEVCIT